MHGFFGALAYMSDNILIAKIEKAHGIRGAVLVRSFAENPDDFLNYSLMDKNGKKIVLNCIGMVKDRYICKLENVTTRNDAEVFRGLDLFTLRENLPHLQEDVFYHKDLIGLKAFDKDGHLLGKIEAVLNFGAGDLLSICCEKEEILLPFSKEFVLEVLEDEGKIIVERPLWVEANPKGA